MAIKVKARKPIRLSKEMLKDKRVLYTIAGSVTVLVFLLWSIAPMLSTDEVPTNIFETQEIRGYDLSQMPFNNDLVEGELLGQEEYKDIKAKGSTGVIYSPEDKKQRKARDKYTTRDSRGKTSDRDSSYSSSSRYKSNRSSGVKQNTQVKQMRGSGGFRTSGGGGTSTSGKVWSGKDAERQSSYGSKYGTGASGVGLNDADKRALAKQIALQRAGKLSEQAAGAEGEAAAEAAVEAFSGGEQAADLDTELEQAAAELDLGDGELTGLGEGNLANAIDSAVDKAEIVTKDPLPQELPFWDKFWWLLAETSINTVGDITKGYFSKKYGYKVDDDYDLTDKEKAFIKEMRDKD
ncbi:MAG: hypothetical protein HOF38_00590 [Elusimicrobiaceae bacterium]|nr:hypothetical protein [Elusimicrobiaceae bacterium]